MRWNLGWSPQYYFANELLLAISIVISFFLIGGSTKAEINKKNPQIQHLKFRMSCNIYSMWFCIIFHTNFYRICFQQMRQKLGYFRSFDFVDITITLNIYLKLEISIILSKYEIFRFKWNAIIFLLIPYWLWLSAYMRVYNPNRFEKWAKTIIDLATEAENLLSSRCSLRIRDEQIKCFNHIFNQCKHPFINFRVI